MTKSNEIVSDFNRSVQRHLNCLTDENRNVRRKALCAIQEELSNSNLLQENFEIIFINILLNHLLKSFTDKVEKCRELSLTLIENSLDKLSHPEKALDNIIPAFVKRLGQQDILEPSEEIRLQTVKLVCTLIEKCSQKIAPFVGEIIKILQQTLVDSYPEVKKTSCVCTCLLAKTCPQYFHMESELLIKPLLLSITHQHSKVRVQVINTIGTVIQYGNGKSVDDVVCHLAQRMFDGTVGVRMAVIGVVGGWLLDLQDRYSYQQKLMPLLLSGVTDEVAEVACEAEALWNDVGEKYLMENEDNLKDKIDFQQNLTPSYPSNKGRPNLGCRQLVYTHYSKILPAINNDISDWIVDTRLKAAKLLHELLLNEEDNIIQHLDKTLECLYKSCNDPVVSQHVMKSAQLIGYFVEPNVWVKMVVGKVSISQTSGCVLILANIIKGTDKKKLSPYMQQILRPLLDPNILQITDSAMQEALLEVVDGVMGCEMKVMSEEVRLGNGVESGDVEEGPSYREGKKMVEVVEKNLEIGGGGDCVKEVDVVAVRAIKSNEELIKVDESIFKIFFYVKALCKEVHIDVKTTELIKQISELLVSKEMTYSQRLGKNTVKDGVVKMDEKMDERVDSWVGGQIKRLLACELVPSCDDWTSQSPELKLFETLVTFSPACITCILPEVLIICQTNLHPDKHHEVKHRSFALLSSILATFQPAKLDKEVMKRVLVKMILPNLVWKVGRMAEVVRKGAVSCFYTIVSNSLVSSALMLELVKEDDDNDGNNSADSKDKRLLSLIKGLLEDDNKGTRLTTLYLTTLLFDVLKGDTSGVCGRDGTGDGKGNSNDGGSGNESRPPSGWGEALERQVYNFYPELLKRMDDSSDEVRVAATYAFSSYLNCLSPIFDTSLYSAHLCDIFKALLIHMDDSDARIQEAVCGVLQRSSWLAPEVLLKLIETVQFKHRSTFYCDKLTKHIHSLKL